MEGFELEEVKREVSVKELDDAVKKLSALRKEHDELKTKASDKWAQCEEAEAKLLELLEASGKKSYDVDGVARVTLVSKTSITDVPRLEECKSLLAEIVGDNEQKCILWCSYKYNYKMLARVCDELGFKYVFITGEQNTNEKREAELAFRDNPEVKVAICNRRAGGVGVNLVAASHSIVYSRNFSLEEELQSEARNYRSGSERHESIVKIDLAVKDSIDEEIMLALSMKHQVSTDILYMVK